MSHNYFGMADEYCCDGGYWQDTNLPNLYNTKQQCQALSSNPNTCETNCPSSRWWPGTAAGKQKCKSYYASQNAAQYDYECDCEEWAEKKTGADKALCVSATASDAPQIYKDWFGTMGVAAADLTVKSPAWCGWGTSAQLCCQNANGDGWWKSDADACRMESGTTYEPDCQRRLADKFGKLKACSSVDPIKLIDAINGLGGEKVIIAEFGYNGDKIIAGKAKIAYGLKPDNPDGHGPVRIRAKLANGTASSEFRLYDPKKFYYGEPVKDTSALGWYKGSGRGDFLYGGPDLKKTGALVKEDVSFSAVMPVVAETAAVEVVNDSTGEAMAVVETAAAFVEFCKDKADDADCQKLDAAGKLKENLQAGAVARESATGAPMEPGEKRGASAAAGQTDYLPVAIGVVAVAAIGAVGYSLLGPKRHKKQ